MKSIKKLLRAEAEKFLDEYDFGRYALGLPKASENEPIKLSSFTWAFKGQLYKVLGNYADDEFRLLTHLTQYS